MTFEEALREEVEEHVAQHGMASLWATPGVFEALEDDEAWADAARQRMETATTEELRDRLEYLRQELRAERISYGELAELQGLVNHIDPDDVELLQAGGVPEHGEGCLVEDDSLSPSDPQT